jgi:hypothetical protein
LIGTAHAQEGFREIDALFCRVETKKVRFSEWALILLHRLLAPVSGKGSMKLSN